MSSAHIFYIPICLFIGALAGFYLGRRAAEAEAQELKKRRQRRQLIRDKQDSLQNAAEDSGEDDEGDEPATKQA